MWHIYSCILSPGHISVKESELDPDLTEPPVQWKEIDRE